MMAKNVPPNIDLVVTGKRSELEKLEKFGVKFETQAQRFKILLIEGKWILFEIEEA